MRKWFTQSDRPAHLLVFFLFGAALFGFFRWDFANTGTGIPGFIFRIIVELILVLITAWGWEKLNEKYWFTSLLNKPQSRFDTLDLLASFIGGAIPVVLGNLTFNTDW